MKWKERCVGRPLGTLRLVWTLGEKEAWSEQDTAGTGERKTAGTDTLCCRLQLAASSVVLQPEAQASSGSV